MNPHKQVSSGGLLIVDDSPAALKLLVGLFKQRSLKVRVATSGALALEAARRAPPDLILLDIRMPRMDGYEVCAALKADPVTKAIPVIFITASDCEIDKVKAFHAGCVDYVIKPFRLEEVEARVLAHLALRRQERELQEQYDKLKESEHLRDSLAHMIVHDMRSPLMALEASLGLIQSAPESDPTAAAEGLEYARHAVADLTLMTSQLLDIRRLEAGQMPLHKEKHDLARTLEAVLRSVSKRADARRVKLQAPASCPAVYDQDIIRRVLANLLSSAFKATPKAGEVELSLADQGEQVRVSVSDGGRSIPPEYHHAIFDKSSLVDLRNKGISTGLGLAFCQLALEAHGGRIGLESRAGGGNTFWFTLPLASAAPEPSAPANKPP